MNTIEIPRFLLDYFDSNTIHTPLAAIEGYTKAMLKGASGPLTDEQRHSLEIIQQNAERLNNYFSFVIHNQHYLVWDQETLPTQLMLRDLVDDFKIIMKRYAWFSVQSQIADNTLSVWVDRRHIRNAFAAIGEFASYICDKNKEPVITLHAAQQTGALTLQFELSRAADINLKNLAYYKDYLYIAERVMELHRGDFVLQNDKDALRIILTFRNLALFKNDG
jgi:phospho-acceptor domain-containing protein